MELLDPKSLLLRKSAQHRDEMQDEVRLISERTEKILVNALIIGGALASTYLLVRQLSKSKKKTKRNPKPGRATIINQKEECDEAEVHTQKNSPVISDVVTQVGLALASEVTTFLLNMAKEKLVEYLQSQIEKKNTVNENP